MLEQCGGPLNAEVRFFLESLEGLVLLELCLKIRTHDPYSV
jgi:hypothetical protein